MAFMYGKIKAIIKIYKVSYEHKLIWLNYIGKGLCKYGVLVWR